VPEVHVNWGDTPQEYWIAVFDRGSGLPVDPEAIVRFWISTKVGHVGAGLAIVAQAAVAVGGRSASPKRQTEPRNSSSDGRAREEYECACSLLRMTLRSSRV